jgi:ribonuclease-3
VAPPGLAALEARLGHTFRDPDLLLRALTHPSYAHERPPALHNEALGFLGDAALGFVVAEILTERAPQAGAGILTQQRAALVSTPALAAWAARLEVGPHLRLGRGEAASGGRDKESILATAFEAVLAALYLDGGLEPVRKLVARLLDGVPA